MYMDRSITVDGLDYDCWIEIQGDYSPGSQYEPPSYPEIEVHDYTENFNQEEIASNPVFPTNYFDPELVKQRLAEAIYWDMRRKGEFI